MLTGVEDIKKILRPQKYCDETGFSDILFLYFSQENILASVFVEVICNFTTLKIKMPLYVHAYQIS